MKGLKIAVLMLVPVLLSGCYTQLQVQQTQEREYRSEKASVDGASEAVYKSDRDVRRRSVTGYYGADHYRWNTAYHRFHTGFYPYHSGYHSSWWSGYNQFYYRPGTRIWLSFRFGTPSPFYGWPPYYAWNHYSPWMGPGFGHYYQFNNFYLFGDEFQGGFAINRGDRENARYGPRSIGSSRIGSGGSSRADGRSVGSRAGQSSVGSDAATRVRGGGSDASRSSGSGTVTRTRSGGTGSGNDSSGGSSRSRGGNDDGSLDRNRSNDAERIRYRPLPSSSSSSGTRFPVFRVEPRDGNDRSSRARTSAVSWRDYSFSDDALRSRLDGYRVEGPENVRVNRRSRGGFLQRLGEIFETSRRSYEGFFPDRGSYGTRSRDSGSSSRGTVTRSSGSDNTRSRGGSSGSSRSRGSGSGDDGNSRSRGGN